MDFEIARLNLSRLGLSSAGSLEGALVALARISASTLGVARVSVWTFAEDGQQLRCQVGFQPDGDGATSWPSLRAADIPGYLAAIRQKRVVCADDAASHPATRELAPTYLGPLGITSMLDAPIYQDGRVMGVVCHEHVGAPRSWTEGEQDFAAAVADVVATLIEQARRLGAEDALGARDRELREAQRLESLARLSIAVAHDFTSVLSAVRLLAGQLVKPAAADRIPMLAREIEDATQDGLRLAQQLLSFGRASQATPRALALADVVAALAPMLEARARGRGALVVELDGARDRVSADPFQIEQIVTNLVANALDALPPPAEREGRVTVRVRALDGERVALEVEDDGAGMTDEVRLRAFEPYFTTKTAGRGTGLGLAIVREAVERLGGAIAVRSAPGAGTRITVAIPALAEVSSSPSSRTS